MRRTKSTDVLSLADCDEDGLVKTAEGEILSADGELQQVLRLVREALPEKLRETAYWVALEIAAADRLVRPEEIRFLDMLGDALELDRLTTAAIERGMRLKSSPGAARNSIAHSSYSWTESLARKHRANNLRE